MGLAVREVGLQEVAQLTRGRSVRKELMRA